MCVREGNRDSVCVYKGEGERQCVCERVRSKKREYEKEEDGESLCVGRERLCVCE